MKKILLISKPCSQYEVLSCMLDELQRALQRRGIQTFLCDCSVMTPDVLIDLIETEKPDCTWSINFLLGPAILYEPYGIPQIYSSVDGLTYCNPKLGTFPNLVAMFVDKISADLFTTESERPAIWFPHAISLEYIERVTPIPYDQRPYDVVFLGSFIDHTLEKSSWEPYCTQSEIRDLCALAEEALENPSFALVPQALTYIQENHRLYCALSKHAMTRYDLVNSLERYGRGLDRHRLLSSLPDHTIHIFTNEEWKEPITNCVFHAPVLFEDVLAVCSHAKIVLNSCPHIREGFHERLLLSLASGAVTISSKSLFLPSWLEEEEALITYTTSTMKTLASKIKQPNFDIERIHTWLKSEHTWDARLNQLLPRIEREVAIRRKEWELKKEKF